MLDIYSIDDKEDVTEYPIDNNYLGSLSLEEHKLLDGIQSYIKENNLIFPYFEDSRLYFEDVKRIILFIEDVYFYEKKISNHKKSVVLKFKNILELAVEKGFGIVSYCD